MYRAKLWRALPSIDHFLLTPKKYKPLLRSTSSFVMSGPKYSMIRLPLGIRLRAINPRPVFVRLTAKSSFASPFDMRHILQRTVSCETGKGLTMRSLWISS